MSVFCNNIAQLHYSDLHGNIIYPYDNWYYTMKGRNGGQDRSSAIQFT